ncbi:MAG: DUF1569 domain-containing protein [Bacteroidota bacterium]
MGLTHEQIHQFFERIDDLHSSIKPLFGKMNANQMVCHCTDFFRMAKGAKQAWEYGKVNAEEIIALVRSGKVAPAPKGFGQIEKEGTMPTDLEGDIKTLKEHILEFSKFDDHFEFAEHPYFGHIDKNRWTQLAIYHLNHHLKQFGV